MESFNDINQNPEIMAWLQNLSKEVQAKKSQQSRSEESSEPVISLPRIDMSRKFRQVEGKTYPEYQGTVSVLPVPFKGQRVIELNGVYKVWCPIDDDWNRGFMYRILPEQYYPEGEVRSRIHSLRNLLKNALDADITMSSGEKVLVNGKPTRAMTWKECKRQNISLMLGLVLNHRNTKGDLVASNLYGGDTIVEHRNIPALLIFPNNKLQIAIKNDLDMKPDPIPYAYRVYSDTPLNERKGWLTIKFTDATKGLGYDVSASTDIVNPIIMPDGLLPTDFNFEDERVKLLFSTDPIKHMLDRRQVSSDSDEYFNQDTLRRLEDATNFMVNRGKAKAMKAAGFDEEVISNELNINRNALNAYLR